MKRTTRRLLVACCAAFLVAGHPTSGHTQLGAFKKKADEALKKKNVTDSARAATPMAPVMQGDAKVWDNYDFVPGSKVIFFTDFSEDKVGNFARRLKYVKGPVEVVERDGIKVLRAIGPSEFLVPVGKLLPQRFTLEIDVLAPPVGGMSRTVQFEGGSRWAANATSVNVVWCPKGTWIEGNGKNMGNSTVPIPEAMQPLVIGKVAHLRVLMDSGYFKMYTNERRMYNIPELAFRRDSVIRIAVEGAEADGKALYLTGIRVAESDVDVLYDALANKGRWATQGILFATGKAELQPESRPVLKEIAATLKQHGELKILIEGHTDNVGAPASNLALSDARAAAVKAALVADFGIDAARVTTKGLGDTKPAVPNTTSEGRSQNRRVEVVKQ
jgi:OOP family OmpA-OmpF porin